MFSVDYILLLNITYVFAIITCLGFLVNYRVATGQGNSRSGKSQGILEFVREIWNFVEEKLGKLRKIYIS